MRENIKATGRLGVHINKHGKNSAYYLFDNLVVSGGLSFIASRLKDTTDSAMSHIAIGTGSVAALSSDTAISSEVARSALNQTIANGTDGSGTVKYTATFLAGTGTGSISEAGIFNSSSGGTMLCRTTFGAIQKNADDRLDIDWLITFGAS